MNHLSIARLKNELPAGSRVAAVAVAAVVGWLLRVPLVQTPLRPQRFRLGLRRRELEHARLLRQRGALLLGPEAGHQLGDQPARLLGVEVADLLWHVHQRVDGLVVALLLALLHDAALAADLDGDLLALGVADELAAALVDVSRGAGRLVHGPALLGRVAVAAVTVAPLDLRPQALPHRLADRLLGERDLALFLKVFLARLLLRRLEVGYVGVVALLHVLVSALQDRVLGDRLHVGVFDDAQTTVG